MGSSGINAIGATAHASVTVLGLSPRSAVDVDAARGEVGACLHSSFEGIAVRAGLSTDCFLGFQSESVCIEVRCDQAGQVVQRSQFSPQRPASFLKASAPKRVAV